MNSIKQYVCSADTARKADAAAIVNCHIPSLVLMEHAASAVADAVLEHLRQTSASRSAPACVSALCGPGNNGADGMAIMRILALKGVSCAAWIDFDHLSAEGKVQALSLEKLCSLPGVDLQLFPLGDACHAKKNSLLKNSSVIVDALFGIGLSRPLSGMYLSLVELVNSLNGWVISVDLPSGIDADTGKIQGGALRADQTVVLDCIKWGLLLQNGPEYTGNLKLADIGIPASLHEDPSSAVLVNETVARSMLPSRKPDANKGTFGKVLMCGGSLRMSGALTMAAKACFACGCGTLTLYTPAPAAQAIASKMNLAMLLPARADADGFFAHVHDHPDEIKETFLPYTQLAIGNGMGTGKGALNVLRAVLLSGKPCVIDADAINLCGSYPQILDGRKGLILTPHLKEFSRLSNLPMETILEKPAQSAQAWLTVHPGKVLVLKSDFTLISDGQQRYIIARPDTALAKGGSGDVLCGIITGLKAAGASSLEAAVLGAWVHNQAAKYAISPYSFTPLDLVSHLGDVFRELDSPEASQT